MTAACQWSRGHKGARQQEGGRLDACLCNTPQSRLLLCSCKQHFLRSHKRGCIIIITMLRYPLWKSCKVNLMASPEKCHDFYFVTEPKGEDLFFSARGKGDNKANVCLWGCVAFGKGTLCLYACSNSPLDGFRYYQKCLGEIKLVSFFVFWLFF